MRPRDWLGLGGCASEGTVTLGDLFLDLYPSELLTPNTTRYEFDIRYTNGAILRRIVTAHNHATWLLTCWK